MAFEVGNHKWAGEFTLEPTPIPPQTVQVEEFGVKGLFPEWEIHVGSPDLPTGLLMLGNGRVPARDTVEITFYNVTDFVIYPGICDFRILAF